MLQEPRGITRNSDLGGRRPTYRTAGGRHSRAKPLQDRYSRAQSERQPWYSLCRTKPTVKPKTSRPLRASQGDCSVDTS
jgi:hypothetical protein